jgi:hypothetical protein
MTSTSQLYIKHNHISSTMTGFLDLPLELRYIIYDNVLETIIAENNRIFWGPKVWNADTLQPVTTTERRKIEGIRPNGGAFLLHGFWCSPVTHRDIAYLVPLAQSCKFLYDEVLKFAWSNSDLAIQGTFTEIHHELSACVTFPMTTLIRSCMVSLELAIHNSYELRDHTTMEEIVTLVNTCFPALKRLEMRLPNIALSCLPNRLELDSPAKAVVARLYLLRLEISVVFHVYQFRKMFHRKGHNINTRYRTCDELAALLTAIHTSGRTTALDRHRKKQNRELLDLDYYLLETVDLRFIAHHEEDLCHLDHLV